MESVLDKIKKIEALIQGAQTKGEKNTAISAKERILSKYPAVDTENEKLEFSLRTPDSWHKRLLIAICRKHGLKPYRYKRQNYTTVMVQVNERFLNEMVWKEYLEYSDHLEKLVDAVTGDLIEKIYKHEDEDIVHGRLT